MDDIKQDLNQIKGDVAEIKITLAVNTESLVDHMRRTSAAEQRITAIENRMLGAIGGLLLAIVGAIMKYGLR